VARLYQATFISSGIHVVAYHERQALTGSLRVRLLVVEDDPQMLEVLRRALVEQGYSVDLATDGEVGLALAQTEPYDLVILDILLPKLDGYAVCQRLRSERHTVPILMLTARDAIDDRVKGLDSGADDYLTKPFSLRELLARVRALLRRESLAKTTVVRVADLEVDTATHDVRRGGRPITLTSKEYAILEYFVRNPNRVLSRTQIAEHVWNYDFVAMSNIVDVYVGYLRRKLDDGHPIPLFHTVRGSGYQLRVPKP
jgi:DNA-binding response OmpR family regulator